MSDIKSQNSRKLFSLVSYLLCFIIALAIECVILLPLILANLGMNHAANASLSQSEINSNYIFFIFHLPTVLLTYGLDKIMPGPTFIFITPLTQIIFWTVLFAYINRRRINNSAI